ncbi:MAG: hypothetical protein ACKOW0_06765, partial [Schleiferiaceae bacterium]
MLLKKLLLAVAALLLSLSIHAQTLTQTVRGTVVDADSKFPLPGAVVRIGSLTASTDENGQFTLKG